MLSHAEPPAYGNLASARNTAQCRVGGPEVIFHSSLWAAQVGELSECGVGKDSWTQAVKITSFNIKTPLTKYFLLRAKEGSCC